jgi:hypothetical protein
MDPLWHALRETGQGLVTLLSSPFLYISILLVWWHERRAVALQRRMFHVRLYGTLSMVLRRTGTGLLAGAALSVTSLAVGARLSSGTLLCLWVVMLLLSLVRLRYLCMAYAAGVLGVLQFAVDAWAPDADRAGALRPVLETVGNIDVPGLLLLAGLLHIAEGLLVRLQSGKTAIPLYLEGKRGKPIGAYAMNGLWPVPLLWLVPAAGADGFALPWIPLFGGTAGEAVMWTLLAFPVLVSFGDRTFTFWPEQKVRVAGYALMLYGLVLALLAYGAYNWEPLAIVASVAAFGLHELVMLHGRMREAGRPPLYAPDGSGVRILAVLPGTPAAELGLLAGETIRKVNGLPVWSEDDLHAAIQRQPAFCKLEVLNREGHVKFLQRARYAGEHHLLGLILAPDDDAQYVAVPDSDSLWTQLRYSGAIKRNHAAMHLSAAAEHVPIATETAEESEAEAFSGRPADQADGNREAGKGIAGDHVSVGDGMASHRPAATGESSAHEAAMPPRRTRRT